MGSSTFIRGLVFGSVSLVVGVWCAHIWFAVSEQGSRAQLVGALTIPLFGLTLLIGQRVVYHRKVYWMRALLQLSVLTGAAVAISLVNVNQFRRIAAIVIVAVSVAALNRRYPIIRD